MKSGNYAAAAIEFRSIPVESPYQRDIAYRAIINAAECYFHIKEYSKGIRVIGQVFWYKNPRQADAIRALKNAMDNATPKGKRQIFEFLNSRHAKSKPSNISSPQSSAKKAESPSIPKAGAAAGKANRFDAAKPVLDGPASGK